MQRSYGNGDGGGIPRCIGNVAIGAGCLLAGHVVYGHRIRQQLPFYKGYRIPDTIGFQGIVKTGKNDFIATQFSVPILQWGHFYAIVQRLYIFYILQRILRAVIFFILKGGRLPYVGELLVFINIVLGGEPKFQGTVIVIIGDLICCCSGDGMFLGLCMQTAYRNQEEDDDTAIAHTVLYKSCWF